MQDTEVCILRRIGNTFTSIRVYFKTNSNRAYSIIVTIKSIISLQIYYFTLCLSQKYSKSEKSEERYINYNQ